ncbi:MAG TPA: carboxylesterase family protein [Steroidobacteraceae bacterium]|nr:carboxylesterase family protein [Steroidobacteraceae bacterium]
MMKHILRCIGIVIAMTTVTTVTAAARPDPLKTRAYIDHAWGTLTRSMDDCSALSDSKVGSRPVLYLPADLPKPAQLDAIARRCHVDVRVLPHPITRLGDLSPDVLPTQGLLYLPNPYVVPGGFFNEMYGWDSYFIVLGLVADHREALARGMLDNALFEVAHYGAVLNANRTYYLTRSQPPFLSSMIRAILDDPASFAGPAAARAWLRQAYPLAVRDHATWTRKEHLAGRTGLARYFDYGGSKPVLEMRSSTYLRGVIDWLRAHPAADRGYLLEASAHPDAAQTAQLRASSCDLSASTVCAGAWSQGYRLSAGFYLGDRAMRESGFDTTFRMGPFGGSTHHYAPVDLNSLLYRYERDLHDFALQLGLAADARHWAAVAEARRRAIDKYLWRPAQGMYMDYDFVTGRRSHYPFISTFYPLWAGVASTRQARALRTHLGMFERMGGLQTSDHASGAQWDAPFGWAPTNWLAIAGLDAYGFHDDARRLARKFTATIDRSFAADGTIREKYNMVSGNADVKISAGYKANVIGFGWTNAVYLKLQQILHRNAAPRVTVDAGILEGRLAQADGVTLREFRGIPYAAPPVGALRWRAPQPAVSWPGVHEAQRFGPRCMQLPLFGDMVFRSRGMSEDCLYLNVWTPAPSSAAGRPAALPVLVYFFGGGFVGGDGSELRYDGASLAARGIVTVTVNYRLGVFGFLALPALAEESPVHAAGNYGLLDQIAALRWVRRNIARFGGDPTQVTIGGESAGSISVSALMASPLAKDLMARAIGESGALISPIAAQPLARAEQQGAAFRARVGAKSLAALRALPADTLLRATDPKRRPALPFGPDIDGHVLAEPPAATLSRGAQAHVPLLLGSNSQEGFYTAILRRKSPTAAHYRAALERLFGRQADRALALYPGHTAAEVERSATALAGDLFIAHTTWRWMDLQRRTGRAPVYFYYFTQPRPALRHPVPGALADAGAVHSGEIEYALGNLDSNKVYAWTAADHQVSTVMEGYFSRFIKNGNPNGPGLPVWPAVAAVRGGLLRQTIGATVHTRSDRGAARQDFLSQFFAAHAGPL